MGEPASFVYVIQAGKDGPVKIGWAVSPKHRLAELQTGNHETLRLVTAFSGGVELEQALHRELSEFRLRGEWFKPCPEVAEVIKREIAKPGVVSPLWTGGYFNQTSCCVCGIVLPGKEKLVPSLNPNRRWDYELVPEPERMCPECEEFKELRDSGEDPFAYLDQEAA